MGKTVFDLVWADQRGWVNVPAYRAVDGKWIERWFEWPQDRKMILAWVRHANRSADVYWSPLVYPEPSRTFAHRCSSQWAWADIDEGDPDDGPEPTVLWETSPGRTQALYRLTVRVNADLLERVNRGIASLVGADPSGWDAGQVLRVPGTRNLKYKGHPRGRILHISKAVHDPAPLAARAPERPKPQVQLDNVPSFEDAFRRWGHALSHNVAREIIEGKPVTGERSDKMIWIINHLVRAGVPDEDIFALAQGCPHNKWRGRWNEEEIILREIAKAKEYRDIGVIESEVGIEEEEPEQDPPPSSDLIIRRWSDDDWLYDYMEAAREAIPWASPWYHLAGGLVCLSVALGNVRHLFNGVLLPPSTYVMTIGPSRSGKSDSLKFAQRVLMTTNTIRQHVPMLTEWSPQGLLRALQESPSRHVFSYHDEAAKLFEMAKADFMLGAKDFLRELYNTLFFRKVLAKQSTTTVENPCLTWYGAITPEQFVQAFTPSDLSDGTLPRFWLFYDPNAEPSEFRPVYSRTDLAVEDLARRLDQIRERVYSPGQRQVFGTTITPQHLAAHAYQEAWDLLNEKLRARMEAMEDRPEMVSILQNYGLDVIKFALFRVLAANPDDWAGVVEVTPAQIEEAFEILNQAQDNSIELVGQLGQSKDERLIELIVKFLARQPRGTATRTQVMQRYGRSIGRNMDILEAQMLDRGLIEVGYRTARNGHRVKVYKLRRTK